MLSWYGNNMHLPHRLFIVVFLATLLRLSITAEYSTETPNIIDDIRKGIIHHENTLSQHGENQTNSSLSNPNIVGLIINTLNCGFFPNSPNSHLKYSLDYSAKRLLLFQECDRYFKTIQKTDSLQVQCKYKKWIFNKIVCQMTTCPPLTAPPGGHISTNDNTYNTTVYFWCDRGFDINGTDNVICKENAVWNLPPPTCHVSHCLPLLPPRHGFVSRQEEIAINQTIEFSCKSKYSIIGDAVLRCENDGRWNTSAPVCKKMCIVPNLKNQSEGVHLIPEFKYLSIGSLVHQSQRVIFSCKESYTELAGLSTCIEGFWLPPIRCKKTCTPIEVNNGTYILSKDSSTIEYSCQPGFQLVGQRKLSCKSNIAWDNEAPICVKMCTLPESPYVLSFRNKTTYEIIPFGTKIIDRTEVYSVCRYNTSHTVTKCFNGQLPLNLCVSTRIRNYLLEINFKGNWCPICETSVDICERFEYRFSRDSISCDYCCDFDYNDDEKNSFVLSPKHKRSYYQNCMGCY